MEDFDVKGECIFGVGVIFEGLEKIEERKIARKENRVESE